MMALRLWMALGAVDFAINMGWLLVFNVLGAPISFRKIGARIGLDSAALTFCISLALNLVLGPVALGLSAAKFPRWARRASELWRDL
jgi:hypothetical protein